MVVFNFQAEFMQYGKILEIRINTGKGKTGTKGPGHQVPNFGFIAFDDEESVQRCLNSRVSIFFYLHCVAVISIFFFFKLFVESEIQWK